MALVSDADREGLDRPGRADQITVGEGGDDVPQQAGQAKFSADVCCATHTGQVRERNEDTFLGLELATAARRGGEQRWRLEVEDAGLLLAVFDGMGGAASGDVASRTAADVVARWATSAAADAAVFAAGGGAVEIAAERLYRALREANRSIRRLGRGDRRCHGMGTTATAAVLLPAVECAVLAHVGDSRAYLLRAGQLVQLTEDQSLSAELVAHGELDSEELARSEYGNVILQALGVNSDVEPFIGRVALRRGDWLLLCTDGLTDMVDGSELLEIVLGSDDPQVVADTLVERANANGGHDNVTVVIAGLGGPGLQPGGQTPVTAEPLQVRSMQTVLRRRAVVRHVVFACGALLAMLAIAVMIVVFGGH